MFGQVTVGSLISDIAVSLGIRCDAMIGLSLGESAGLFGVRCMARALVTRCTGGCNSLRCSYPTSHRLTIPPACTGARRRRNGWTGSAESLPLRLMT